MEGGGEVWGGVGRCGEVWGRCVDILTHKQIAADLLSPLATDGPTPTIPSPQSTVVVVFVRFHVLAGGTHNLVHVAKVDASVANMWDSDCNDSLSLAVVVAMSGD